MSGSGPVAIMARSNPRSIGHLKHDNRMDRCWLKGQTADALHAVLCAAGYLHPLAARGRLYVWGSRVPSKPGELLTLLRERHVPGLESPTSTRRARPIQLDKWAVDTASQAPKQPTPAQILLRSRHRDLRS
ncbi:MAG: hypothetical protein B7X79_13805 [Acidovorax sp. 17-64-282]|nr:MAG: hypothetical protein B7Y64_18740 [Acidovorax sp. 35-64-16]OYY83224.1 MAG: hypothetical protein B7Y46_16070 [Acidovorax sp. 28-64-14]OYZ42198.1 MAG: hypothetical protein B7Y20_18740 [Acidovorax sp. 16-64-162]OZA55734.1 MAG: hypothetical protein B7X79_13805 [Acidovorax sp. 17-64-282]OZA67404.1 MAG: hypothetical protein B7X70_17385 [Acidovorax sp. 39-64-12]RDD91291.1 hypothetical protein DTW89_18730 [Acidovorax sp. BoFeN1]